MLYILYCRDDPSRSARIRSQFLSEHLQYLERHQDILLLGGAMLAEDGKTRVGSTLVLNVRDREQAIAFSRDEPFRRAGLYASIDITRMRRAQWFPANAPQSADGD
jgi:uncharacterized protein YciI